MTKIRTLKAITAGILVVGSVLVSVAWKTEPKELHDINAADVCLAE